MKKTGFILIALFISLTMTAQENSATAKKLLNEVSEKMGAYKNMVIGFNHLFENKEAGVKDAPIRGKITLAGEKYSLDYLGNNFLFDGKQLVVINKEETEISINDGDMEEEDGFIYPSKLLTFYNEGYNFKMGKLKNINGRKVQFVELFPIDSNSEIEKVLLGIDAKTKHIYMLTQIGANGAETTYKVTSFKSNQPISKNLFTFNKDKYLKLGYTID